MTIVAMLGAAAVCTLMSVVATSSCWMAVGFGCTRASDVLVSIAGAVVLDAVLGLLLRAVGISEAFFILWMLIGSLVFRAAIAAILSRTRRRRGGGAIRP